jgi:hypothetical protein
LAKPGKVIAPFSNQVRVTEHNPDRVVAELKPVVIDQTDVAADTMGHIWYRQIVDTYTQAALDAGRRNTARQAQENLLGLCKKRQIVPWVVQEVEARLQQL